MWRARATQPAAARLWRRHASSGLPAHVPAVELQIGRRTAPVGARNIYCIGRNYAAHAIELNNAVPTEEPVIFMKSNAALRGLEDERLAFSDETFHFEAELVLLVGEHVPLGALAAGRELECLKAAGLGLDLTRRGKQSELKAAGLPWTLSKSFEGSAIVGPMLPLDDNFALEETSFELKVNGKVRQTGHVDRMIFSMPFQLRYLNASTALLPGDLLFTGTPEGVGELVKGDRFSLRFLSGPAYKRVFAGVL